MNPLPSFYQKGLSFSCTACGKCCSNRNGYDYVYVTKQDQKEISKHLQISFSEFVKRFAKKEREFLVLRSKNKSCIFLQKNGHCEIYAARPLQCRTFPFWPENLNPVSWKELQKDCPGMNKNSKIVKPNIIAKFLRWEKNESYPLK